MLICDMKGHDGETLLHYIAPYNSATIYAKICLEVDGNYILKALTAQERRNKTTLHYATGHENIELVKFLLDAADIHVQDFMNILDKHGKTAFDIATPEIKAVMLPYMQNNQ